MFSHLGAMVGRASLQSSAFFHSLLAVRNWVDRGVDLMAEYIDSNLCLTRKMGRHREVFDHTLTKHVCGMHQKGVIEVNSKRDVVAVVHEFQPFQGI
jgi:hypothetical protein